MEFFPLKIMPSPEPAEPVSRIILSLFPFARPWREKDFLVLAFCRCRQFIDSIRAMGKGFSASTPSRHLRSLISVLLFARIGPIMAHFSSVLVCLVVKNRKSSQRKIRFHREPPLGEDMNISRIVLACVLCLVAMNLVHAAETRTRSAAHQGLKCEDCHNEAEPKGPVVTVSCAACHDAKEVAAAWTGPQPNPHDSKHWGTTLPCESCHKEHSPDVFMCNDCHEFDMSSSAQ